MTARTELAEGEGGDVLAARGGAQLVDRRLDRRLVGGDAARCMLKHMAVEAQRCATSSRIAHTTRGPWASPPCSFAMVSPSRPAAPSASIEARG